jgi:hypothetical protein
MMEREGKTILIIEIKCAYRGGPHLFSYYLFINYPYHKFICPIY